MSVSRVQCIRVRANLLFNGMSLLFSHKRLISIRECILYCVFRGADCAPDEVDFANFNGARSTFIYLFIVVHLNIYVMARNAFQMIKAGTLYALVE